MTLRARFSTSGSGSGRRDDDVGCRAKYSSVSTACRRRACAVGAATGGGGTALKTGLRRGAKQGGGVQDGVAPGSARGQISRRDSPASSARRNLWITRYRG